jgi:hypothetical protein
MKTYTKFVSNKVNTINLDLDTLYPIHDNNKSDKVIKYLKLIKIKELTSPKYFRKICYTIETNIFEGFYFTLNNNIRMNYIK